MPSTCGWHAMLDRPPRESRARSWWWVALVTALLYVGIVFARDLQEFVEARFGRVAFLVIVAIALVVIAIPAFISAARRWWSFLWLVGIGAAYAWGVWRLRYAPVEALHFVEYAVLGIFLFRAFSHDIRDPLVYAASALAGGLIGAVDEIIQYLEPRRSFEFHDMRLNAVAGGLMQLAIALGIRPAFIRPPVSARSIRIVCGLTIACAALLSLCFMNTLSRQEWIGKNVPPLAFMGRINDLMTEFGYLHEGPPGVTSYSRLTPAELQRVDAEFSSQNAALLDRFHGEAGYRNFAVSLLSDPLVYEARVRLFRRDKYAAEAVQLRDHPKRASRAATIAFRENQLVERLYPHTLARSQYVLRSDWRAIVERLADTSSPYRSPVSSQLFTTYSEFQIQAFLALVMLVALAVSIHYRRREPPRVH